MTQIKGPIIGHNNRKPMFNDGVVYVATESGGACCYAESAADLEPYRALGWSIATLEGDELNAFLEPFERGLL